MSPSIRHAPLGVNASFDFGPPGAPAGFAVPANAEPSQQCYVGCRQAGVRPWSLLPFFPPSASGPQPLPTGRYGRFFALAGDKWMIGPLVFKVCTPFPLDKRDESFLFAPVVCGYLEYDNSHSDDAAEMIFGLSGDAQLMAGEEVTGFHFAGSHGYATTSSSEVIAVRDQELFGTAIAPANGLIFHVPPQSKRIFPLAIGFAPPGENDRAAGHGVLSVLKTGLREHSRYLASADALDAKFMRSALEFEQKNQIARDIRAWLAHTKPDASGSIELTPLREMFALLTGPA